MYIAKRIIKLLLANLYDWLVMHAYSALLVCFVLKHNFIISIDHLNYLIYHVSNTFFI